MLALPRPVLALALALTAEVLTAAVGDAASELLVLAEADTRAGHRLNVLDHATILAYQTTHQALCYGIQTHQLQVVLLLLLLLVLL